MSFKDLKEVRELVLQRLGEGKVTGGTEMKMCLVHSGVTRRLWGWSRVNDWVVSEGSGFHSACDGKILGDVAPRPGS